MSDLKPCPYPSCKSEDIEIQVIEVFWDEFQVICNNCLATGPMMQLEDAIREWNTRAEVKADE